MGKLEKHIKSGDGLITFEHEGYYYHLIDNYRVLRSDHPLEGFNYTDELMTPLAAIFNSLNKSENCYKSSRLPDIAEVKEKVKELSGRSKKVRVIYYNRENNYALNSVFLQSAMDALNAEEVCNGNQLKLPVFLFQDDDILSGVCECICSVNICREKFPESGFYKIYTE